MQNSACFDSACFVPGLCVREPRPPQRISACGAPAVREHLTELAARLRLAHSAAVTCVAALRRQNCELDEDVARLLQRCVADVLGAEIEQAEEMLGVFADPDG